ncbi:MAG: hypothetical protein PUJ51_07630 [Clostridiales bacterium]|uniref:hypothetical protein n=1 Tax=Terrisporobacter sp. TaxID=1965305 RepID=UPI002A567137|nr:hypothetical protein [Terrisporobacter sp.]MDD7754363.1 hypothetical protein [Clostridiales bacterium]MDY4135054.1 hypothetical protein [Terrisporobacter sp.]
MAKVSFTKLGLKKKEEIKNITINDQVIEVRQYLPISDKINIITNVIENSADDNNFANPVKVEVFANLEIMYAYTNISFTDKQKEDPTKLYDLLEENGIIAEVIAAIPENEYTLLLGWIDETIEAFYTYRNSVMGIMEQISEDYSNLSLDATEIQQKLADPQNLELLKNIMTKLG